MFVKGATFGGGRQPPAAAPDAAAAAAAAATTSRVPASAKVTIQHRHVHAAAVEPLSRTRRPQAEQPTGRSCRGIPGGGTGRLRPATPRLLLLLAAAALLVSFR
eukprot:GHVU01194895.1.p1 GENE.GHVU01194895.1~~GHVU01194895.1.p1  ORF type:complete len:104 (-),score=20.28 GHVU01194895.1:427-738(-)